MVVGVEDLGSWSVDMLSCKTRVRFGVWAVEFGVSLQNLRCRV